LSDNTPRFDTAERLRLYRALAEAYGHLGAHAEAVQLWHRIIALRDKDLSSRLALFDLALLAGTRAAMEEQIAAIQKLEGEQEGSLWRFCRAAQYVVQAQQGDKQLLAEASDLLKVVAERRPGWARVSLAQGQIDELRGRFDIAVANYQRAVALGEQRPAILQQLVRVLIEHGEVLAADRMIRKLRAQSPSLLDGLERPQAVALLFNGEKEQALMWARKAVPPDSKKYRDHIWLGQLYWAAGPENAKEAEESLRRAVALAEAEPEAWLALVQHLVRMETKAEAAKVIGQAEAKLPLWKGRIELGQCCEMIGDTARAKEFYEAAFKARPNDARVLYAMAGFCLRSKEAQEAERHLRRILKLDGAPTAQVVKARRVLAIVMASGGDYQKSRAALALLDGGHDEEAGPLSSGDLVADQRARVVILANQQSARKRREAITILESLRTRKVATPDERFLLARLYVSVGEWKKARSQLVVLLTSMDTEIERTGNVNLKQGLQAAHAGYLAYYASELLRRDEAAEARPWQAKLETLEPKTWRSLEVKARLLGKGGHGAEAVDFLRTAAKTDPVLLLPAAHVLEQIGQAAVAQQLFEQYAANTTEPRRVLALATFLARQDRPEQALDVCENAWKTCAPEHVANASVSAVYSAKSGAAHAERAARRMAQAIAAYPEKTSLLVGLAALRRLQGRTEEALKVLRQASARDKGDSLVRNNIAWLLALQGRADEALEAIGEAMVLRGEESNLLDTRAVAYLAKGKHALAIDDLHEAIAERPTASRYFHLARAELAAGNPAAAHAAIERGKNLGLTEVALDPLERPMYRQVLAAVNRR
jgi:tetratricopeptide (TPR) repeat protein